MATTLAAGVSGVAGWEVVAASLSLVAVTVVVSWWLDLGVGRDTLVAAIRASVQLLAVGFLFRIIFESPHPTLWAVVWIVGMAALATAVVVRRAGVPVTALPLAAALAVAATTAISLGTVFGFGVLEAEPVSLVVVAGITIGNVLPAAVLAARQSVELIRDHPGQLEALLALGFDRRGALRFTRPRAARTAILPHIERTKVVGIVALPGAMTGLLLAGVEPVDAVIVQLLVMLLVLGSAAVAAATVVVVVTRSAITERLMLADWARSAR